MTMESAKVQMKKICIRHQKGRCESEENCGQIHIEDETLKTIIHSWNQVERMCKIYLATRAKEIQNIPKDQTKPPVNSNELLEKLEELKSKIESGK